MGLKENLKKSLKKFKDDVAAVVDPSCCNEGQEDKEINRSSS